MTCLKTINLFGAADSDCFHIDNPDGFEIASAIILFGKGGLS
jgi:hypothetical protein